MHIRVCIGCDRNPLAMLHLVGGTFILNGPLKWIHFRAILVNVLQGSINNIE